MSRFNKIEVSQQHQGQVLTLTLASGRGNVLDGEMISELTEVVQSEARGSDVKALVFQGKGEHFCYGASVQEHRREHAAEMLAGFHTLLRSMIDLSKPGLALIRGCCLGGGLELAGFCQWIFAAEGARFGQPEIALGVFPPTASLILPWRVGQPAADDLILTGRTISAAEAKQLGLVHSVSAQPEVRVEEFLQAQLLPKSAAALSLAVRASRFAMHRAFLQDIQALEEMYLQDLMNTEDAHEGIEAFMEKRQPVWSNR